MDLKGLKFQILSGSIARRVLLRAIVIASALSVIPLLQTLTGSEPELIEWVNPRECGGSFAFASSKLFNNRFLRPILSTFECKNNVNFTTDIVMELMGMKMIDSDAKTLCVGEGSASAVYALVQLGFVDAVAAFKYPLLSLKHKSVYELEYEENLFDFVLSGDLDKVSVPAILVLEIERVLKPGGIGVVLVGASNSNQISLIKLATPVSSLLKSSNVVQVDYIHNFTLVVFEKRINGVGLFGQYSVPADCQSVVNNKPFMGFLEPLVEKKPSIIDSKVSYLPNFINVASKNKLAYVEIGAGQRLNSSNTNWFLPSYPIDRKAFDVYFVDHNTSVLLSCIKKPGVTFIYYPGLAGENATVSQDTDDWDPSVEDDGFDFLAWFKETVQFADLVVLKMKAGKEELKFLADLFKTGAICLVDELFLSCSDHDSQGSYSSTECMDLFKSLRSSGVFVHQWWED